MKSGTMYTDQLIADAAKGQQVAITRLVQVWQKRIYNFCLKYFGNHDVAMEITQKTFITMCSKLHTLKDHGQFRSWLYTIAANYCHDEKRRSARTTQVQFGNASDEDGRFYPEPESEHHPMRSFEQEELSQILKKALGLLSEEQRLVVIMKEYEGFKFHEIAEVLQISENTAKSRLYYGLDHLRKILNRWNITKETLSYGH
jgi:RNA polymerase sigma factor (sigma-70 family)